eukprot:426202-Pleurochrysis_carterae.AAC.1
MIEVRVITNILSYDIFIYKYSPSSVQPLRSYSSKIRVISQSLMFWKPRALEALMGAATQVALRAEEADSDADDRGSNYGKHMII